MQDRGRPSMLLCLLSKYKNNSRQKSWGYWRNIVEVRPKSIKALTLIRDPKLKTYIPYAFNFVRIRSN
jgi:hypothetical protein